MSKVLRSVTRVSRRAVATEMPAGALGAPVAAVERDLKARRKRAAAAEGRKRGELRQKEAKVAVAVGRVILDRFGAVLDDFAVIGLCEHLEEVLDADMVGRLTERGREAVERMLQHPVALNLFVPDAGDALRSEIAGLPLSWVGKFWSGKANLGVLADIARRHGGDLWVRDELDDKHLLVKAGQGQPELEIEMERHRQQLAAMAGGADRDGTAAGAAAVAAAIGPATAVADQQEERRSGEGARTSREATARSRARPLGLRAVPAGS